MQFPNPESRVILQPQVPVEHPLFIALTDPRDTTQQNQFGENFEWGEEMLEHVTMVFNCIQEKNYDPILSTIARYYSEELIPYERNVGQQFNAQLHAYYQKLLNNGFNDTYPSAHLISDYFAFHHRRSPQSDSIRWNGTSFLVNPIGIPRTQYYNVMYNHLLREHPKYRSYSDLAKVGVIAGNPEVLLYDASQCSWRYQTESSVEIPLIMTTKTHWFNMPPHQTWDLWNISNKTQKAVFELMDLESTERTHIGLGYIAQGAWWQSNIMHYRRGSAAITAMVSLLNFKLLGINNVTPKKGIAPDLEAYITELPQYIANYPYFFV